VASLVLVLVIVLIVTNAASLAVLAAVVHRRQTAPDATDRTVAAAVADGLPPTGRVMGRGRRIITIEILNPIELAGHRSRMFGIAGSFVPDFTRRLVYEQTAKVLRDKLVDHSVVADVRVHTVDLATGSDRDSPPTIVTQTEMRTPALLDSPDADEDERATGS
jgi:hypothetical protein